MTEYLLRVTRTVLVQRVPLIAKVLFIRATYGDLQSVFFLLHTGRRCRSFRPTPPGWSLVGTINTSFLRCYDEVS